MKWVRRLLADIVSDMADKGGSKWTTWLAWWLILAPAFCGVLAIVSLLGGIDWATAVSYGVFVVVVPLLFRLVDRLVWRITKSRRGSDDMRQAP